MSDNDNPYVSTQVDMDGQKPSISQGVFTSIMIGYLKDASPWIRFISILGFIGSGISILSGLVMTFSPSFMFSEIMNNTRMFAGFANAGLGFFNLIFAVVSLIPYVFLYRFGEKINTFIRSSNEQALELAFSNNKSYWKFQGIVTIISLAAVPVIMIISIIVGFASYF